jgi:FKBP-type peptidyl-prolyl cis-trans isomerase SlyD
MVTRNQVVSLTYELRTDLQGELVEQADEKNPLEFICGQGQTLEYFEMNLLGLNAGDAFDFKIPAAQAYGVVNEEMIVTLPVEIFSGLEKGALVAGNTIPMEDSLGRHLQGMVEEVTGEHVRMNFNHRLAGEDLYFKGRVLGTREATDAELERLHSSACGGCHSHGCGDDGCHSGCCH